MKRLTNILSLMIVAILLSTNLCFGQNSVGKLMPSAEVVFVNLNLKYPMVDMLVNEDTDFKKNDIILSAISMKKN